MGDSARGAARPLCPVKSADDVLVAELIADAPRKCRAMLMLRCSLSSSRSSQVQQARLITQHARAVGNPSCFGMLREPCCTSVSLASFLAGCTSSMRSSIGLPAGRSAQHLLGCSPQGRRSAACALAAVSTGSWIWCCP